MDNTTNPKNPTAAAPAGDIHDRIAKEAKAAANNEPGYRDGDETPALAGLFDSAAAALNACIPSTFEHEGRTYFMRACVGVMRLRVFDTAASIVPMSTAMKLSAEEFGHKPFH